MTDDSQGEDSGTPGNSASGPARPLEGTTTEAVPRAGAPGLSAFFGDRGPIQNEIDALLPESKGQLGQVAQCIRDGVTDLKRMVDEGAAANVGAAANLLVNMRAIRNGEIPESAPSRARLALGATRSFLKQHRDQLSKDARDHLDGVIAELLDAVEDPEAQAREEAGIQEKGDLLEERLVTHGGVYAYTFPHYYRYPTVEGTNRTLLKVGMTTRDAEERVRAQARQAGLPEDPLLLRVYQDPSGREPRELEKIFHRILNAAGHARTETRAGGKEWFETSVDLLDAVAETLGLSVLSAES